MHFPCDFLSVLSGKLAEGGRLSLSAHMVSWAVCSGHGGTKPKSFAYCIPQQACWIAFFISNIRFEKVLKFDEIWHKNVVLSVHNPIHTKFTIILTE